MRRRSLLILTGILVVALGAAAGGVYAYDAGHRERLARGVKVGGIDVGGLEAGAARAKLRAALLGPLNRPVRVRHREQRFTLTARQARIAVDVRATVDRALARSREGNAATRAWRDATGGRVDADVPVRVDYSRKAVDRLVARVRDDVERPARDAELDLAAGRVEPTPSRTGVRVRATRLEREVTRTLLARGPRKPVRVRTATVAPKVSTKDLERRYPTVVIVDRAAYQLTLYRKLKVAKTYRIAVGQAGLETPAGLYNVQNKAENPAWHVPDSDWAGSLAGQIIPPGPANPIKARWMGIYDGAGIHGTDAVGSLGTAASHGCIRMAVPDVVELYDQVPVNAPVYIA